MSETCVSEWTCQCTGNGDGEERGEYLTVGEYGEDGWPFGGCAKVNIAYESGEKGLEGIEEDGEFEVLGRGSRTIWSCGESFLEESPCKTGDIVQYWIEPLGLADLQCAVDTSYCEDEL